MRLRWKNKPDVVLYEEGLDDNNITNAVNYIRHADMLIIGGTSLGVYPAAGLIDYYGEISWFLSINRQLLLIIGRIFL